MKLSFLYPQYLWLFILLPLTIALGMVGSKGVNRFRYWAGLFLRGFVLSLIILALAGLELRLPSNILTTVFVLDISDSISPTEQERGVAFIEQAIQEMNQANTGDDLAAIVVFGENALVERLASEGLLLDIASVPITTRTDIASALQLAQALFPNEGAKRLVLLSDGRENIGKAVEQAEIAEINDIQLLYLPIGDQQRNAEVLLESLKAPADIRLGEDILLEAEILSTTQVGATLRTFVDGKLFQSSELILNNGTTKVSIDLSSSQAGQAYLQQGGFHRFRVQVIPEIDNRLQNNEASAFTVVHGPPQILIVESQKSDGKNLANALKAAEMEIVEVFPEELPTTLAELARYDAVILVNVHAAALPVGVMEILPVYVSELGRGLLMTGGQESFGAGGYLRTPLEAALPVTMDVKDKDLRANLALVLAVDKSGSMGRCHCDNPDLSQSYTRTEVGQPKVDIAKEAIMRAASVLGNQDYLGVVAFDQSAHWALPIELLVDPLTLEQAIGTFTAEGQTNLQSGVQAAIEALQGVTARRKHIILMTDGWVNQGDLSRLAVQLKDQGITLSVIAAGKGSAEYLAALADLGGGRYYPAVDILNVPDIFLQETVKSVGQYIIEQPFYPLPSAPGPVLRGLDVTQLPALLGYNGTSAKNTARLDLMTPRGDPLLATWQYGLGRAAVWTSDMKAQWAKDWLAWDGFSRFAAQLVGWILPAPKAEGLEASASFENGQAIMSLIALDNNGYPLNSLDVQATMIDPDLESTELTLSQVAAGQYQVTKSVSKTGTYLIRLGVNNGDQSLGQLTLGLVVPYSPEYKASGVDIGLLNVLAETTGGHQIINPMEAYEHNLPSFDISREIWSSLLLIAVLLFPLDVAVRRLIISSTDLRKAKEWLLEKLPNRHSPITDQPPILGRLFQARGRARARQMPKVEIKNDLSAIELPPPGQQDHQAEDISKSPPSEQSPDSLARLKEAKKRARR